MAIVLDTPLTDRNRAWHASYRIDGGSGASWAQHGLPALFDRFQSMRKGSPSGPHLDIGCGNAVKTPHFARGTTRAVGLDIALGGLRTGSGRDVAAHLLQADSVRLPFKIGAFGSASDILCFTHIPRAQQAAYVRELHRVLAPGGYVLVALFSLSDEHFHGHPIAAEYAFRFDSCNPHMTGYEHYEGKINVHFDRPAIVQTFGGAFDIEEIGEFPHPLYPHRKLWNAIIRRRATDH
jgi:SAM-dependent methyltransferase